MAIYVLDQGIGKAPTIGGAVLKLWQTMDARQDGGVVAVPLPYHGETHHLDTTHDSGFTISFVIEATSGEPTWTKGDVVAILNVPGITDGSYIVATMEVSTNSGPTQYTATFNQLVTKP